MSPPSARSVRAAVSGRRKSRAPGCTVTAVLPLIRLARNGRTPLDPTRPWTGRTRHTSGAGLVQVGRSGLSRPAPEQVIDALRGEASDVDRSGQAPRASPRSFGWINLRR